MIGVDIAVWAGVPIALPSVEIWPLGPLVLLSIRPWVLLPTGSLVEVWVPLRIDW